MLNLNQEKIFFNLGGAARVMWLLDETKITILVLVNVFSIRILNHELPLVRLAELYL